MTELIKIERGEKLAFPVQPNHSLARFQSLRMTTRDELMKHQFYVNAVERQIKLSQSNPSEILRTSIIDQIIAQIGLGYEIVLGGHDIVVEDGGTMLIHGSWSWMTANSFVVKGGGVVKVYSGNPAIPAFFLLRCNSFGH